MSQTIGHIETDCGICGRTLSADDIEPAQAELLLDLFNRQHNHSLEERKMYYAEEEAPIWGLTEED
jgi:hypothetical protein